MSMRYNERNKKRNQNRILNFLIAIVVVLILTFGYQLFLSDVPEAAETTATEGNTEENKREGESAVEIQEEVVDEVGEESESRSSDELEEENNAITGGPEGPWEPIGTVQEGTHTSSFTEGTIDWNEKVKALEYATGLSKEEGMVIWWLGNGGGPEKARGVVSLPEDRDNPYEVYLEWIENEGWKPISVERKNSSE